MKLVSQMLWYFAIVNSMSFFNGFSWFSEICDYFNSVSFFLHFQTIYAIFTLNKSSFIAEFLAKIYSRSSISTQFVSKLSIIKLSFSSMKVFLISIYNLVFVSFSSQSLQHALQINFFRSLIISELNWAVDSSFRCQKMYYVLFYIGVRKN